MLTTKKIKRFEAKVSSQPKVVLPIEADLLLQKLGDRWYAFWQLNGEIYLQLGKEVGKVARG